MQHIPSSLSEGQKLVELTLQETFGNVMRSERRPELVPTDHVASRQHGMVVVPPKPCGPTQLLSCKPRLVVVGTWSGKELELGFDRMNPCISVEWFLCLLEQRGLRSQKILIPRDMRLLLCSSTVWRLVLSLH